MKARWFFFAALSVSTGAFAAPPPLNTDRAMVMEFFAENIYGVRPELSGFRKTCSVKDCGVDETLNARRLDVTLNTMTPCGETNFTALALVPAAADGKRAPCFVYVSFEDPVAILAQKPGVKHWRWPVREILAAGFATVAFDYQAVFPDRSPDVKRWGGSKDRAPNGWGAISAWALAASRVMDWIESAPGIDATKVAVVGHSRLGKTALWTGVTDTRFAYTVINCSGCFGARVTTLNLRGETVAQITGRFPHWFAPNCAAKFVGKDAMLPFDQHWLIAAVAPRLVAVGSAEEDHWACPSAEHAGLDLARPAWGEEQGKCHYHIRPGEHDIKPVDWTDYMDFAKRHGW